MNLEEVTFNLIEVLFARLLEDTEENHSNLNHNSKYSSQNSNSATPKYNCSITARIITCSVTNV
jgi:hypothetical protein